MTQKPDRNAAMDDFVAGIHRRMGALAQTVDRDMESFNAALSEQQECLEKLDHAMTATGLSMKAYRRSLAGADAQLERTSALARNLEAMMAEYA